MFSYSCMLLANHSNKTKDIADAKMRRDWASLICYSKWSAQSTRGYSYQQESALSIKIGPCLFRIQTRPCGGEDRLGLHAFVIDGIAGIQVARQLAPTKIARKIET